jgi:hypothetical protein
MVANDLAAVATTHSEQRWQEAGGITGRVPQRGRGREHEVVKVSPASRRPNGESVDVCGWPFRDQESYERLMASLHERNQVCPL